MANLADIYYTTFSGKSVTLYNGNKQIIRKFNVAADVVNAQVNGAGKECYVAIVTKDGRNYLYSSDGRLLRR